MGSLNDLNLALQNPENPNLLKISGADCHFQQFLNKIISLSGKIYDKEQLLRS